MTSVSDITVRNFFRLLRCGTFDTDETIEPMSAYKWRCVSNYAQTHGVDHLMHKGAARCAEQFFMQLPDDVVEQWKQADAQASSDNAHRNETLAMLTPMLQQLQARPVLLGAQPATNDILTACHSDAIDIFFPYSTQGRKADEWAWNHAENIKSPNSGMITYIYNGTRVTHHHRLLRMANSLHASTLKTIVEEEFRESRPNMVQLQNTRIELISPTLQLMRLLLAASTQLLTSGLRLSTLADMGLLLRNIGQEVDFVKLQQWIGRMHLKAMAQLMGQMLAGYLHFEQDEIPFMSHSEALPPDNVTSSLFQQPLSGDWHFQQASGHVFVSAVGSKAMFRQMRHSARYMHYYPSEGSASLLSLLAHSLTHIEE